MTEHVPLDPFASLNLSEFKARQSKTPAPQKLDKEAIRELAAENDFRSRQMPEKKQKIVTKTFSLFPDECDIINGALKAYLDDPDEGLAQPSSSDVVRAALNSFATRSPAEQVALIKQHRGRGRRR